MRTPTTLYRDTPALCVARFRLHQARKADGTFVAVRFSDPATRPAPKRSLIQRLFRLS